MQSNLWINCWRAVAEASRILTAQGIRHALMGTAALAALGYDVGDPPDLDFYVERAPAGCEPDSGDYSENKLYVGGWKVQYIPAEGKWLWFFEPATARVIDGVPVAALADILGAKAAADRPKDREFFLRHPELDCLVPSPRRA